MKKYIWILLLIVLLSVLLYILSFRPIKKAVKTSELHSTEYIMVKALHSTSSTWAIVGDSYSLYEMPVDVTLTGKFPSFNYDIQTGGNIFICYGEHEEDIVTTAGYDNKVFEVKSWEILYPINHNSIFSLILSDKNLYSFEMESMQIG